MHAISSGAECGDDDDARTSFDHVDLVHQLQGVAVGNQPVEHEAVVARTRGPGRSRRLAPRPRACPSHRTSRGPSPGGHRSGLAGRGRSLGPHRSPRPASTSRALSPPGPTPAARLVATTKAPRQKARLPHSSRRDEPRPAQPGRLSGSTNRCLAATARTPTRWTRTLWDGEGPAPRRVRGPHLSPDRGDQQSEWTGWKAWPSMA